MIEADFYPTDMTWSPDIKLTAVLNSLKDADDTTDFAQAYYIGYLDPMMETNPKKFTNVSATLVSQARAIIESSGKRKTPWGWVFNYNFNANTNTSRKNAYIKESDMSSTQGTIGSSRFINSLQTPKLTMRADVTIGIRIIKKSVLQWVTPENGSGEQTGCKNSNVVSQNKQISSNEFIAFMNGTPITVTYSNSENVLFSANNWNESRRCFETEDYFIFVASFFVGYGNFTSLTSKGYYPASTGMDYVQPYVMNVIGDNHVYKFANYWGYGFVALETIHDNASDCTDTFPYFTGFQIASVNEGTVSGLYDDNIATYEIDVNGCDIRWVYTNKKAGNIDWYIPPTGGLFNVGGYYGMAGNNYVRLEYNGSYSPDFMNSAFCLLNKVGTPTDDYVTINNTTPEFTQGGRPTGYPKPSFNQINVLQPWQTGDIKDSEFDPEEIPDEDGDDEEPEENPDYPEKRDIPPDDEFPTLWGMPNVNIAMSKFYVLTSAGMGYLRKALATAWNETDTASFWYKLGEVEDQGGGTPFKIAAKSQDIKNYIVSCRVYPGDLSVFCDSDTQAGIPFGYQGASITGISRKNLNSVYITKSKRNAVQIKNRKGTAKIQDISYLDFEPYTQARIYLPYCGLFPLSMIDILCSTIFIDYTYNFTTGEIIYNVMVSGGVATEGKSAKSILVRTGILGIGCSISGNDIVAQGDQVASATLNKWNAQSAARLAGDNLLTSPFSGLTSTFGNLSGNGKAGGTNVGGGSMGAVMGAVGTVQTAVAITNAYEGLIQAQNGETSANINMMQASRDIPFNMCYGTSSSAGVGQSVYPYIEIDRPMIIENGQYHNETFGRPWMRATKIQDIKGYLKCASPVIENISNNGTPATEIEMQEISQLLRGGVYNGTG